MLLGILLAILMVVCAALIGVILLQRSEGGAFGMSSGGPGAFMTARGTGDFLTRTTEILVGCFFALCLVMTIISSHERNASAIIEKLKGLPTVSSAPAAPASAAPSAPAAPLGAPAGAAANFGVPQTGNTLNLLGNSPARPTTRPPLAVAQPLAPTAQPPAAKTTKAAKAPRRPAPTTAATGASSTPPAAAASSAPPPPSVQPAPVTLPPPPPPSVVAPRNQ